MNPTKLLLLLALTIGISTSALAIDRGDGRPKKNLKKTVKTATKICKFKRRAVS